MFKSHCVSLCGLHVVIILSSLHCRQLFLINLISVEHHLVFEKHSINKVIIAMINLQQTVSLHRQKKKIQHPFFESKQVVTKALRVEVHPDRAAHLVCIKKKKKKQRQLNGAAEDFSHHQLHFVRSTSL